jgi:NAD(P)H-hydrate epimerase
VHAPGDGAWLCDRGNPGMAVAGMGDVLTGTVAGIAAQCTNLALAACAGVYVHATAGDAAATAGERGMLATDVIDHIRAQVNPPTAAAVRSAASPTTDSSSAGANPP